MAASAVLSLLAAESAARLFFPAAADGVRVYRYLESERGKFCRYSEELGWEGVPSIEAEFEWADARCRVRQNRHGFRGREFATARSGAPRIVALGDSFVWGFGVDDPDLFSEIINREADPPVELINLGVSGYGTDQELLLWNAAGRMWQPDRVLLFVTPFTDLVEIVMTEPYGRAKPTFRFSPEGEPVLVNVPVPRTTPVEEARAVNSAYATGPVPWLVERSNLAAMALAALARHDGLRARFEARGLVPVPRAGYDWEHALYHAPPEPAVEESWRVFAAIVSLFQTAVEREGADLVLVVVPSPVQVYPQLWDRFVGRGAAGASAALDPELPNRRVAEVAAARGLEVIDLLPPLREAAERDAHLYFPVNSHWTRSGHRVVAAALQQNIGTP